MSRSERHVKKRSSFWTFYLIFLGLIAIAMIALYIYVRGVLVDYERNTPENYVVWLTKDVADNSDLGKYLAEHNFNDNRYGSGEQRKNNFYTKAHNATVLESKKNKYYTSANPVYDVYADEQLFMTIRLSETGSATKLGIMTMSYWNIDAAIVREASSTADIGQDLSLNYDVVIPEGFSLLIDEQPVELLASRETSLDDFKYVADYVQAPKGVVYELHDLYYEPMLSALNNGLEELVIERKADGTYSCETAYAASPQAKEKLDSICDPLAMAKTWSLFMTDDIGGASHGLNTVIADCRLLKGTNLYDLARRWATNVDITFVSGHTLNPWTGDSVTNYVQYNDNLISCDVYTEKNMTLYRGMGNRQDVFSNRMYFGQVDGSWYLLDMVTLE